MFAHKGGIQSDRRWVEIHIDLKDPKVARKVK